MSTALVPDIPFEDGILPADRTAAAMWTLMERVGCCSEEEILTFIFR